MSFRIPPIIQLAIFGGVSWVIAYLTPFLDFEGAWRYCLAALSLSLSAVILALALKAFIQAKTTVNPLEPDDTETLVVIGLYRISRNPMYVGMAAALISLSFLIGNYAAFVGPTIFIWSITQFQIKPEEEALRRKFGPSFDAYASRTRRWV